MDQPAQDSPTTPASDNGAPPATPDTGGGPAGDSSKINGDTPIQNLPSNYIVQQKEELEHQQMQAAQQAQVLNAQNEKAQIEAAKGATAAKPAANGTPAPAAPAPANSTAPATKPAAGAPAATPAPAKSEQPATPAAAADKNVAVAKPTADMEPEDPILKMKKIADESTLPDELRKVIADRLDRLTLIRAGAGMTSSAYIIELEATQRYVGWTTGLPWNSKSEDVLDLKKAKDVLDKHHFGLDMLKERMLEYIASIMLNIKNNGDNYVSRSPILCFVGLAGTGKTTFAISMAEALGRKFERIPFGGMADSRVLRGQNRYYPDAEPGQIIKRLVHAQTNNPVILFDEVDRVTETARADIMGVLIEVLDPEQNSAFSDHYVDHPFNLSTSLFVATSNNMSSVATAVADRMEIIQMPSYNDDEKTHIGKEFVLPKTMKMIGLLPDQFTMDEPIWEIIIRPLGYDPGVRGLERMINKMCRKAAKMIVSGEAKNVKVTVDNVKRFTSEV